MDANASPAALRRIALCGFASMFTMRFCDALLPALAQEFATTSGDTARVISGFALAYGVMQLFYGPAGDKFGKLRVIALASLGCALAHSVALFAPSLDMLAWARMLCGATAAGVIPLAMAWIGDNVAYQQRQVRLAQLLSATVSGMIAGQWLGGVAAVTVGWRMGFAGIALLFLIAGLALWQQSRQGRNSNNDGNSAAGNAANAAAPISTSARWGAVLREPWARKILLLAAIEGALAYGALSFIPQHLHSYGGLSLPAAGASLALFGLGGITYSRLAGRLLARWGEVGLARIGGAGLCLGYGLLAWLPHWALALPACALAGFGFYALHNTLQVQATQMAPAARGTAVALFACTLFLGQSVGISLDGWVVDRYSAIPVFISTALSLLGLSAVVAWLIQRQQRQQSQSPSAR